jgi:hypothetical protein
LDVELPRGTKHEHASLLGKGGSTMGDNPKREPPRASNRDKDPDDWVTGGETMTGAQASYLKRLCEQAGVTFEPNLSKAEASKRIEELQAETGRGRDH